ncbi:unnamed protein product [Brassica napus]|uniref:(rape) hypothetical protein n=1 Tax=Brassica napus TaxID=3708 RepID=A0A816IZ53_BRANA|nr:unnamed protein product [Brassica napus]
MFTLLKLKLDISNLIRKKDTWIVIKTTIHYGANLSSLTNLGKNIVQTRDSL